MPGAAMPTEEPPRFAASEGDTVRSFFGHSVSDAVSRVRAAVVRDAVPVIQLLL